MVSQNDPDYLTDPSCPYPEELRGYLKRMLQKEGAEMERVRLFEDAEDTDVILSEVQLTIEEMKGMERSLSGSDVDTSDKIAFYRAKTQMLERWTNLKEKVHNIRHMSEFQRIVIGIMEELFDKDQQQEFKNRLKSLKGTVS